MKPDLQLPKPAGPAIKKTIAKAKLPPITLNAVSANLEAASTTADILTSSSACTAKKNSTTKITSKKTIEPPSTLSLMNLSATSCSSMNSLCSDASGVLSDNAMPLNKSLQNSQAVFSTNETESVIASHVFKPRVMHMAKIDLTTPESLSNLPTTVREVFIDSVVPAEGAAKVNLSRLNPLRVAREIDKICGAVERVDHKRSGSLLIVTKSYEQVIKLLKIKVFCDNIAVVPSVAWGSQIVYGKIYAPEFSGETLEDILAWLQPCGVVGVRKFYQDPARANSPLYVLTFLKDSCPETLKVGYSIYHIDPYYPTPLRCGNCLCWGHSARFCHGGVICGKCGQKGHARAECVEEASTCLNCKGDHDAASKSCPFYIQEQEICRIKVNLGITFKEARDRVCQDALAQAQAAGAAANSVCCPDAAHSSSSQASIPRSSQPSAPSYSMSHPLSPFPTLTQLMARDAAPQPQPISTTEACRVTSLHNNYTSYANALRETQSEDCHLPQDSMEQPSWITAGQRHQQRAYPERKHQSPQTGRMPFAQPTSTTSAPSNASPGNSSCCPAQLPHHEIPVYSVKRTSSTVPPSCALLAPNLDESKILHVLRQLLPVVMRLLLCSTMTEKVECFVEIGIILSADSIVGETLRKLGLSSLSSST